MSLVPSRSMSHNPFNAMGGFSGPADNVSSMLPNDTASETIRSHLKTMREYLLASNVREVIEKEIMTTGGAPPVDFIEPIRKISIHVSSTSITFINFVFQTLLAIEVEEDLLLEGYEIERKENGGPMAVFGRPGTRARVGPNSSKKIKFGFRQIAGAFDILMRYLNMAANTSLAGTKNHTECVMALKSQFESIGRSILLLILEETLAVLFNETIFPKVHTDAIGILSTSGLSDLLEMVKAVVSRSTLSQESFGQLSKMTLILPSQIEYMNQSSFGPETLTHAGPLASLLECLRSCTLGSIRCDAIQMPSEHTFPSQAMIECRYSLLPYTVMENGCNLPDNCGTLNVPACASFAQSAGVTCKKGDLVLVIRGHKCTGYTIPILISSPEHDSKLVCAMRNVENVKVASVDHVIQVSPTMEVCVRPTPHTNGVQLPCGFTRFSLEDKNSVMGKEVKYTLLETDAGDQTAFMRDVAEKLTETVTRNLEANAGFLVVMFIRPGATLTQDKLNQYSGTFGFNELKMATNGLSTSAQSTPAYLLSALTTFVDESLNKKASIQFYPYITKMSVQGTDGTMHNQCATENSHLERYNLAQGAVKLSQSRVSTRASMTSSIFI